MSLEQSVVDALGSDDPSWGVLRYLEHLPCILSVGCGVRPVGALMLNPRHYEDTALPRERIEEEMNEDMKMLSRIAEAAHLAVTPRALGGRYIGHLPTVIRDCSPLSEGLRFGYPDCCVKAYTDALEVKVFRRYDDQRKQLEALGPQVREWLWSHRHLAWTHHYPCSLTCAVTRMQGAVYASAAHQAFPHLAPLIERAWLSSMVLPLGF